MVSTGVACPICGRPASEAQHPFCSLRCADVDLGRWLTGQYRVPGHSADGADGEQDGRLEAAQRPGG